MGRRIIKRSTAFIRHECKRQQVKGANRKSKNRGELQKAAQLINHVEKPQEDEDEQDEPELMFDSEAESLDDPETGEGETQDEFIPLPDTEGNKALECTSCDLTFETPGEARAQLSSSEILALEGRKWCYLAGTHKGRR